MHVVTEEKDVKKLKELIREEMMEHGISHTTIEIESKKDKCSDKECSVEMSTQNHHHHHHH